VEAPITPSESRSDDFVLYSGSSHPALAQEIADKLGIKLGSIQLQRFPDGELSIQILESVRGRHAFVVQSVALKPDQYLMELLTIIDALKRASAKSIVAVLPYFGYCRQDRKDKPRVPITAKLVANLLVTAGATKILAMDLHADQIQGFFDIPVDALVARPVLAEAIQGLHLEPLVVLAPDLGSSKLARKFAQHMGVEFAIADKFRCSSRKVEIANIIGDVRGKNVLLADDMCSTGGTLLSAALSCQEKGAHRIFAAVTHGLFVGNAVQRLQESPIEAIYIGNTIPSNERLEGFSKLRTVSVADLFARAIRCIVSAESISSLFDI